MGRIMGDYIILMMGALSSGGVTMPTTSNSRHLSSFLLQMDGSARYDLSITFLETGKKVGTDENTSGQGIRERGN
jgi:hypothetical protein